jgi:FkbM family methyltransferase
MPNGKYGNAFIYKTIIMGLRKIVKLEFNSGFLRSMLGLYYKEGKYYNILFGKLKGLKSFYRNDINFHAVMGFWEQDSLDTLVRLFADFGLDKKKMIVADVGANIGYYSLFFNRYLHADSKIFAFEPSASILDVLHRNIKENKVSNVTVSDLACSDKPGTIEFYIGAHHHQSSMIGEWAENETTGKKVVVDTTSLDEFFVNQKNEALPDLIKMDIEGGGVFALKGCDKCITQKRPFIIVESHTPDEDMAISNVLLQYDYVAYRVNTKKWVLHRDRNYTDTDGVWGTMLLIPTELKAKSSI